MQFLALTAHNFIRFIYFCRPLSKTVRFNVLKVIPAGSSGGGKKAFTGMWGFNIQFFVLGWCYSQMDLRWSGTLREDSLKFWMASPLRSHGLLDALFCFSFMLLIKWLCVEETQYYVIQYYWNLLLYLLVVSQVNWLFAGNIFLSFRSLMNFCLAKRRLWCMLHLADCCY